MNHAPTHVLLSTRRHSTHHAGAAPLRRVVELVGVRHSLAFRMIRILIFLLLGIGSAHAAGTPKLPIVSAEQAASYFRESRDNLLAALPDDRRKFVVFVSTTARDLIVKQWTADNKKHLRDDPSLRGDKDTILGSLDALETSKSDAWSLYFNAGTHAFVAYLDAVSGKVLYIYSIPEG